MGGMIWPPISSRRGERHEDDSRNLGRIARTGSPRGRTRSRNESGLTKELASRTQKNKPFKLRRVTVDGAGLRSEVAHLSMHEIILMSNEDRGG